MARGSSRRDCLDYVTTISACIAAVGAIAAAVFTWWQASIAKDAEVRQLRAYLIVKSAKFARDETGSLKFGRVGQDGSAELLIYYDVSNEGVTPAYDVFRKIEVEYPFEGKIAFGYTDGTSAYISKDHTFGPVRTRAFSKLEIDSIMAGGAKPLVFAGQILYRDIFGNVWPTNFCFWHVAHPIDVGFVSCPRWDNADRLNYAR